MNAPHLHVVPDDRDDAGAGRLPPHDLAAEEAVISAVLLDPDALPRVDFLEHGHFFSEKHRRIFEAARNVKAKGLVVDTTTVATELKDSGRLAQVGGSAGILELLDASPAVANVRDHGVIVFDRWRLRAGQNLARRIMATAYETPDAQDYLDRAHAAFVGLARQQAGKKVETNAESIRRAIEEMRQAAVDGTDPKRPRGILTGIAPLDAMTNGLQLGTKTTVVSKPGGGKSVFGLQVSTHAARSGVGVILFSTEMSKDELVDRQLASVAEVDSRRIALARQKPTYTPAEWSRITQSTADLFQAVKGRLVIHDDPNVTVEDVCTRARAYADELAAKGVPLGLVVVDYVQRLQPSAKFDGKRNSTKTEAVSHATIALRNLAEELGVAVVELAQEKNLGHANGKPKKPEMGDAAESFQIERESHLVMYLWRPNDRDRENVKGLVVKNRRGETGEIDLVFEGQFARFRAATYGDAFSGSRAT
ncbi:Replicative DNA helicase (DnaB) [Labilithrix luteola]|uniref:DNA 5'-3' helicase n=1 Tax=Labilithrix luteola TaxID=1391654 RepID=A0A0K1QA91_9BACT|nr:replicative DNA helicase [Labilithrix luteola]AKV02325.1 Replicative DNA helicase (DnaB) [Labilithrix luteola]